MLKWRIGLLQSGLLASLFNFMALVFEVKRTGAFQPILVHWSRRHLLWQLNLSLKKCLVEKRHGERILTLAAVDFRCASRQMLVAR